ncbi:MAG TPA: hypothetical protein VGA13_04055 [Acidimicrobiales bacterium]
MSIQTGDTTQRPEADVPSVTGFYDGQDVRFIHTEASDPQIAAMSSDMMDSSVIVVPHLRDVPAPRLSPGGFRRSPVPPG